MRLIQKMYEVTKGKKTLVGAIIHFAVIVLAEAQIIFGFQVLSAEQLGQIDTFATVILGVGLVDKGIRRI